MNNVVLIGRLTRDVDLRYTSQSQTAVAIFTLAINRMKDGTDYPRCKAFGKIAENTERYCRKGSLVAVKGRLETGSYQDKDGKTIYTTDVICDNVEFINTQSRPEQPDETMNPSQEFSQLSVDIPF